MTANKYDFWQDSSINLSKVLTKLLEEVLSKGVLTALCLGLRGSGLRESCHT